jgi:ABC-type bacteriocin/lantibiotic exporter with double-glycine peptidase domain
LIFGDTKIKNNSKGELLYRFGYVYYMLGVLLLEILLGVFKFVFFYICILPLFMYSLYQFTEKNIISGFLWLFLTLFITFLIKKLSNKNN